MINTVPAKNSWEAKIYSGTAELEMQYLYASSVTLYFTVSVYAYLFICLCIFIIYLSGIYLHGSFSVCGKKLDLISILR